MPMKYEKLAKPLNYSVKNQETGKSNRNSMSLAKKNSKGKGYANMFSTFKTSSNPSTASQLKNAHYAFPPKSNTKFYLPYDQIDSDDFAFEKETNPKAVDFGLPTRIVCKNSGTWQVINQYQLDCLQSSSNGPQDISGFTTFGNIKNGDGEPVENSSATCTVEKKGDKVVLVIAFAADMNEGDYFKVGVVSTDAKTAIINSYPGATGLTDPICITLCQKTAELKKGAGKSTRKMSDAKGNPLPGTLINWSDHTIPNNNAQNSGIEAPQINESAFIQTPEGALMISGTYDDANFGTSGANVTSIKSAVFKGVGTGKYKDVSLVRIFYDNDGSALGLAGLRKLVLFKEIWEE